MLSKNKQKIIRSLEKKKYRTELQSFVAEGHKLVNDLLPLFDCKWIIATAEWLSQNENIKAEEIISATQQEINKCSFLKTPQKVLAVFNLPQWTCNPDVIKTELCLGLDGIQDPGNLGTIVRLADWFGIEHIFCSKNTVDAFGPKSVQATMGALGRVKIHYISLDNLLEKNHNLPIYGTFLDGEDLYQKELSETGLIIMGNEGNGISKEIEMHINEKLLIPNYPSERKTSESLNVAMATAIVCSEFRRRVL